MGTHNIKTPSNFSLQGMVNKMTGGASLTWNASFGSKWSGRFDKAQAFIDSETLRLDAPLMPKQTGNMINSGTLGTNIGSGEVNYIAPYSARQYYDTATSRPYDANRGAKWFERMKAAHLQQIKDGVHKFLDQ